MISRTIFLTSVLLVLLAATLSAAPEAQINEATFNFGRVAQNQIVTHCFWLRSVGDDTLRVTKIWPGCGCTQIPLEDSTIAPGDSLPLQIIFATGRFHGEITKEPRIRTTASDWDIKLRLYVHVILDEDEWGPIEVKPERIDVSQFGEKPRRIARFHLVNRTDQDLELSITDSTYKSFEVKLPDKIAAGETIEGRIRVREDMMDSDLKESFTIRVDNMDNTFYSLPVRRFVRIIDKK